MKTVEINLDLIASLHKKIAKLEHVIKVFNQSFGNSTGSNESDVKKIAKLENTIAELFEAQIINAGQFEKELSRSNACIEHLKQVVYNVAKSSFEEGADFGIVGTKGLYSESPQFAKKVHSEMIVIADSIYKEQGK
jgi:hypothetical protein